MMRARGVFFITLSVALSCCQAARTAQTRPQRGSVNDDRVPWHDLQGAAERGGFSGSPTHSQGSHSDIDWDELDKALGMHDNHALSPSPVRNREQSPTPQLVNHHLPSSSDARKPFLKLDVDRLQKEVNGNANFQGVRAPLWVSHRDCATSVPEDHASTSFSQPNSSHDSRYAARQSWSHYRYKGRPWQESLSDSQQEQIYKALKEQWGPYDEMKFRLGYREVRKLLDEKTARLILAGHKQTIADMAAKTNPYTMGRKPTKVKKRTDLHWPDESIGIDQRSDIVARLDALWGTDTYATRKRLYKHYRPHMRSAFKGENEEEFRRVAEHIDKASTLGRKTFQQAKGGRKRLRL